jgi:ATP synthase protein I
MTTAQPTSGSGRPSRLRESAVLGPVTVGVVVGLVLVTLAASTTGAPGAAGAAIGSVMVLTFFGFGAAVLGVVARLAPAASLLVALLTYTLQVVLVGVVFLALSSGGALEGPVDARWLAAAVIIGTLVWLGTQVTLAMRARQPIYDLPSQGAEASVR